jgi:spore germination cell wall hydrolase CwlJ-like protein
MGRLPSSFARFAVALASLPQRQPLAVGAAALAIVFGLTFWIMFWSPRPPPVPDDTWERLSADERCLAQAIYFEARGEPLEGRMAVAQVVVNRVADSRWPNDVCAVVFQDQRRRHRCQFSFACDGHSDRPREDFAWSSALKLARTVTAGHLRDLTGQATHYHALGVKPFWASVFTPTVTIGRHRFYRAGS